jgi:SAM-dependent methyltransferase
MDDYRKSHIADDSGVRYDRIYADADRVADAFYWEYFEKPALTRLFAQLSAAGASRYLDFAAGTGRITALAAPYYRKVVGIDVSESMLKEARRKVPGADFLLVDVTDRPPAIGPFDTISMFRFVLNAQPALREGALRWVRSVIAPDGFLVINNHMNTWSAAGIVTRLANCLAARTLNHLSHRQMVSLLRHCGFEVVCSYGFRFLPSWGGRLLMPQTLLLPLEQALSARKLLHGFAKDQVYVCRPV